MGLTLPNIQSIFIPDPGHTLLEVDLKGADAQVVAWESNDDDLKCAFRAGVDVHSKNAEDMLGASFSSLSENDPRRKQLRYEYKRAVHATNYGGKSRTIARTNGWTVHETERFQQKWLSLHPGILEWHTKVRSSLSSVRGVSNAFGYRITFYDRIDSLLPQALAWIPQSTVAILCFKGALAVRAQLPEVPILMNNHDSNIFQAPTPQLTVLLPQIHSLLHIPIPYPDPLLIPWELKLSDKSWGDCKPREW